MTTGTEIPPAQVVELLERCEALAYTARIKFLVDIGRASLHDTQYGRAISWLHLSPSLYHRLLGLYTCYGSRDASAAIKALSSQSLILERLAVKLTSILATDDELLDALPAIDPSLQVDLVRRLRYRRRRNVIDAFASSIQSKDKKLFADTLAFCSADMVQSSFKAVTKAGLPDGLDWLGQWKRLARTYPQVVMDPICDAITTQVSERSDTPRIVNDLLPHLAHVSTARYNALSLLRYALKGRENTHQILAVVRRYPRQFVETVLDMPEARITPKYFRRVSRPLSVPNVVELFHHISDGRGFRAAGGLDRAAGVFEYLRMDQRIAIFDMISKDNAYSSLNLTILRQLPREMQIAEARHYIESNKNASPRTTLVAVALLPWDEAKERILQSIQNDVDCDTFFRAEALRTLIKSVPNGRYKEALELVLSKRRDQDLVRRELVQSLRDLDVDGWTEDHLPSITQIVRQALDATDLSHVTAQGLANLCSTLIPLDPAWSWNQIMLIHKERGHRPNEFRPKENQEKPLRTILDTLSTVVAPVLEEWMREEEYESIIWLFDTYFTQESDVFPQLQNALMSIMKLRETVQLVWRVDNLQRFAGATQVAEDLIKTESISSESASSALTLLKRSDRTFLSRRIPALILEDPTWIVLDDVKTHLLLRRQDLLTPFLTPKIWKGRFNRHEGLLSADVNDRSLRARLLTENQQNIVSEWLVGKIRDQDENSYWDHSKNLEVLGKLNFVNVRPLLSFAQDSRSFVRDVALQHIAHLEERKGFPKLYECLEDDRASVAIHIIGPLLRKFGAEHALTVLKATPLRQVTVAKEVIRLVSDLRTEDSYQYLLELDKTNLHRDVRHVLDQQFENFLDRRETWDIMMRISCDERHDVALTFIGIPTNKIPKHAQPWHIDLLLQMLGHPSELVPIEVLKRCGNSTISDPEEALLAPTLLLLKSPRPSTALQAGFLLISRFNHHVNLMSDHFNSLTDVQAIRQMANKYVQEITFLTEQRRNTTHAIIQSLKAKRLVVCAVVNLLVQCLPWSEVFDALSAISPRLHADAVTKAAQSIRNLRSRSDQEDNLPALEAKLRNSDDEIMRRLGLSALDGMAQPSSYWMPSGWTDDRRAIHVIYLNDRSELVAEAASLIQLPTLPPKKENATDPTLP